MTQSLFTLRLALWGIYIGDFLAETCDILCCDYASRPSTSPGQWFIFV